MGEVYRAHDLTLRQPVALKFLPDPRQQSAAVVRAFQQRSADRAAGVAHERVPRLRSRQGGGRTFLSMEYMDGEDLGISFTPYRACAVGQRGRHRTSCAPGSPPPTRGVLHRDLKPANVMLDGRGHVVVMDFGLAAIAGEITQAETRQGTMRYMAPEQLAGKEVTTKSDVYALGLILYEIFTGKRAFESNSAAELLRLEEQSSPTRPSTLVKDLDPGVEHGDSSLSRIRPSEAARIRPRGLGRPTGRGSARSGDCGWRNAVARGGCRSGTRGRLQREGGCHLRGSDDRWHNRIYLPQREDFAFRARPIRAAAGCTTRQSRRGASELGIPRAAWRLQLGFCL